MVATADAPDRVTELQTQRDDQQARLDGYGDQVMSLEAKLERLQAEKSDLLQRGAHGDDVFTALSEVRRQILDVQAEIADVQEMRTSLMAILRRTEWDLNTAIRDIRQEALDRLQAESLQRLRELRAAGIAIGEEVKEIASRLTKANQEVTGEPYWGAGYLFNHAHEILGAAGQLAPLEK